MIKKNETKTHIEGLNLTENERELLISVVEVLYGLRKN